MACIDIVFCWIGYNSTYFCACGKGPLPRNDYIYGQYLGERTARTLSVVTV